MATRPRDYRAHGAAYDALMHGVTSHYLALLEASMLVEGKEIETERAVLEGILDDREAGLHRRVEWRSIDRDVCTCSLVLPPGQSVAEALGHVNPVSDRLLGTFLVEDDGTRCGVCQHCSATFRDDSFERLRQWQQVHVCPPDQPLPEPKVPPVDVTVHRTSAAYFRSIVEAHVRAQSPRSDGPQE